MDKEEIKARASKIKWFHNYELIPGVMTNGYKPVREEELATLFQIPRDLRGKRVLDVGCADGFYTFLAESRGADVVTIDAWPHQGFLLAHEIRGSKAEFHQMNVYDLQPDTFGTFDIVFFMGVYYHLKNPILALERIANVTRELAIIESQISGSVDFEQEGISHFYEYDELAGDPTNWWAPNVPCLLQTVRAAGFPRADLINCYSDNNRAVVHAYKGLRTAAKMLTEDIICRVHTPVANAEVSGIVPITGAAFNKREPEGGIEQITIYLDKLDDPAFELGVAEHGHWHTELAARVGDKFGPSGFVFNWDTAGVAPGLHTLYVLAEGQHGWRCSRQPVFIIGDSGRKFFNHLFRKEITSVHETSLAKINADQPTKDLTANLPGTFAATNQSSAGDLSVTTSSKLAKIDQLAGSINVSFSTQSSWPLANNVRRALHNLVIYYVNMLANKQKVVNQATAFLLRQIVTSQARIEPDMEALQAEIVALHAEVQALQAKLEK